MHCILSAECRCPDGTWKFRPNDTNIVIFSRLQRSDSSLPSPAALPLSPDTVNLLLNNSNKSSQEPRPHPQVKRLSSANDIMPSSDILEELDKRRSKDDYIRRRPLSHAGIRVSEAMILLFLYIFYLFIVY